MSNMDLALSLIKDLEKFRPTAYQNTIKTTDGDYVKDKWTVGYGTTYYHTKRNRSVKEGDTITGVEAEDELIFFVDKLISPVIEDIEAEYGEPLPYKLRSCMYSLAYNCGIGSLKQSVKDSIIARDLDALKDVWLRYKFSQGKVIPALETRRKEEFKIFEDELKREWTIHYGEKPKGVLVDKMKQCVVAINNKTKELNDLINKIT